MKFGSFIPSMLLSEQAKPFDDDNYIFELKFDGIRANVHASSKGVRIFSRRGNEITDQYPELQSIKRLVSKNVIFDGEIVSFHNGKPSFSKLQKRNLSKNASKIARLAEEEPVVFVAFDCIYEAGTLCGKSLIDRKKVLAKYEDSDEFVKATYISSKGCRLFKKVVDMGLEGIVAKKKTSIYEPGIRTKEWIKIKNFIVEKFIIGGYVMNSEKVSLLLGEMREKGFYFVGKVSISKNCALYEKLKSFKKINKSPFADYTEDKAEYLPLKFACEISYIERTQGNILRQPVFKREVIKEKRR